MRPSLDMSLSSSQLRNGAEVVAVTGVAAALAIGNLVGAERLHPALETVSQSPVVLTSTVLTLQAAATNPAPPPPAPLLDVPEPSTAPTGATAKGGNALPENAIVNPWAVAEEEEKDETAPHEVMEFRIADFNGILGVLISAPQFS